MGKHSHGNLYNRYREWVCTSKSSGEEQGRGGHASLRQCRLNVLCEIDQESGRLREVSTSMHISRDHGNPAWSSVSQCTWYPDTRSSAPLRGQPRSLFRPDIQSTWTPSTDAARPTSPTQTRSAPFEVL